jgi:hypothetical protein
MRTEELIADLATRAVPVRPLPSPAIRVIAWSVAAIVSATVGIALFGMRPDIGDVVRQPTFIWMAVLALGMSLLAVTAALVLAIPGAERSAALRGLTVSVLGLWTVTLLAAVVFTGLGFTAVSDWHWPICFVRVMAIGLVPAVVLRSMLRRAAPLRLGWTSALAMMAATATGAVAIQFICPLNDPAHALFGHFGPVLAIGLLGAAASGRVLR